MQQISKSSVKNYILSLKNPEEEGFILQQQYNQSTIMSSAFSILALELIDCLNQIDIKKDKWINSLKIKSNYKDTLNVTLEEELPLGIYDNSNNKILFVKFAS